MYASKAVRKQFSMLALLKSKLVLFEPPSIW